MISEETNKYELSNCQIADDLELVANYMEENGWTKGTLVQKVVNEKYPVGSVCALGSIRGAILGDPEARLAHDYEYDYEQQTYVQVDLPEKDRRAKAVEEELKRAIQTRENTGQGRYSSIVEWNDSRSRRTGKEIMATMRKVAKRLRAEAAASEVPCE